MILKIHPQQKLSKHIASGFLMPTIASFRSKESKHDVYRGKDCMKKFCEFLRKLTMKQNKKKKQLKVINKRAARII